MLEEIKEHIMAVLSATDHGIPQRIWNVLVYCDLAPLAS